MSQMVFCDGECLDLENPSHHAKIAYLFQNGLGTWRTDTIVEVLDARGAEIVSGTTTTEPVIFHWENHYERLISACKSHFDLGLLPSEREILIALKGLLLRVGRKSSVIHIRVDPGLSDDLKNSLGKPALILDVRPYIFASGVKPLKLMTIPEQRSFPQFKLGASYGTVTRFMEKYNVEKSGYDSFIYCSNSLMFPSKLLECPYENLFFINQSQLLTPLSGVLHGVTRRIILEQARAANLFAEVAECSVFYKGVYRGWYKEAFRTSTTKGVVPIEQIDKYHFRVGEDTLTEKLRVMFLEYRERYYQERGA